RPAALREVPGERVGLLDQLLRLAKVDDVDAAALGEDEPLHLRVPAAGLVAEMDSGLEQLSHGDDGHGFETPFWLDERELPAGLGRTGIRRGCRHPRPGKPPGRERK